jgi:2,5-furandicarboxylate decarboxylase 1
VEEGEAVDLGRLPILRQHQGDLGHYVTAGHCTTVDPESGIDNTAIQRCCVRGPRRLTFYPYPGSHNARNVERWWARGEPCPVAIWIGHHPRIAMAAQAQLGYPQSHWAAAGGGGGEPIALTPSRTFGERILVPADAEIVIEGWCPANVREADGPFAEYTGVMGVQIATPVIDVTCVTRRRDAWYHDIGAGLEDHLVPDNLAMEARIWSLVKPTSPSLIAVHVPFSGRRFNVYLQFRDPRLGEVRDALAAALSYRRIRTAIAVDEDIDPGDDRAVLWALATRMTWGRDAFRVDGLSHPNLDPSLPAGASTITKLAIDATLQPAPGPGLPKPFTPRLKVGEVALAKARALLAGADSKEWPQE